MAASSLESRGQNWLMAEPSKSNSRGFGVMQRMKVASAGVAGALIVGTALGTLFMASASMAQEVPAGTSARTVEKQFNIPPQSLQNALTLFGQQAGIQVSVNAATIRSISSSGVSGRLSPQVAIERLLAGSGLPHRFTSATTVVVGSSDQGANAGGADTTMLEAITVVGAGNSVTEGTGSIPLVP